MTKIEKTKDEQIKQEKDAKYSPYYTDEHIRKQIDKILAKSAYMECNLGIDSTRSEIIKTRVKQDRMLTKIKDLDPVFYERIAIE